MMTWGRIPSGRAPFALPQERRGALGQRTLASIVPRLQNFRFQQGQMPGLSPGLAPQAPAPGLTPSTPTRPPLAPGAVAPQRAGLSSGLAAPAPAPRPVAKKPVAPAPTAPAPAPVNNLGQNMEQFLKYFAMLQAAGATGYPDAAGAGDPAGAAGAAAGSAGGGGMGGYA